MTNNQLKVLEYVSLNKSVNEIIKELNINEIKLIEILNQLKNKGYEIKKEYYSDGSVILRTNNNYKDSIPTIHTGNDREKFIIKSDTHYGSYAERPDLDDIVMDYAVKNNYHLMFHLGDFIDGISDSPNIKGRFKTEHGQLKYAIKRCPRDKSVIQLIIFGNHDCYSLEHYGFNIGTIIEKTGFDLVPIGFERGRVNIGKDSIGLFHRIGTKANPDTSISKITLIGHTHRHTIDIVDDRLKIFVPTISDIKIYDSFISSGFLTMNVGFNNKREIIDCVVDHMVFDNGNNPIISSEFQYQFKKK